MNCKRKIRARKIDATTYLVSQDEKIAENHKASIFIVYNNQAPNQELVAKIVYFQNSLNIQSKKTDIQKIIKLQHHQNLVKYHSASFLDQTSFCVIMDYYDEGSLLQNFTEVKLMPQEKIWLFIQQICKGYQKLFDHDVLHLKIKPSNILISEKKYKISDVGLNSKDQIIQLINKKIVNQDVLYMPPEINQHQISPKFDVYSFGCIIYQLAYDDIHPFETYLNKNGSIQDYFQKVKTSQIILKQKNKKGETRSPELRDLIKRMLEVNPQKRISWQQMFQHDHISINKYHKQMREITSQKENQIQMLRKTLNHVNRSSVIISQNVQNENQQNISKVFIALQKIMDKQQIKYLQRVMLRLKIILLTIIHNNHKINSIIRQNVKHKKLPGYIIDAIKKIVVEGFQYLLKNIEIISNKINDFKECVIKDVKDILNADRQRILNEYKKEMKIFKNIDEQTFMKTLKSYDLRSYQHCLYNILTVYCDYHKQGKQILRVTIAILIDIYDTALRLTEMTQKQKISLRSLDYEQIQTQMDQICLSPHRTQQFHSYLMKKQLIREQDVTKSLKQLGLFFV